LPIGCDPLPGLKVVPNGARFAHHLFPLGCAGEFRRCVGGRYPPTDPMQAVNYTNPR
jgi:hypothetical protein